MNITAAGDWPSQSVYLNNLLTALIRPSTCLHTPQALATAVWLNNTNTATSEWWYTWFVFQVQYYDMPRLPGARIESPATLGRKCWAFAYLQQIWEQKDAHNNNTALREQLQDRLQHANLPIAAFANAYDAALVRTLPLCNRVMANCFVNSTYLPAANNGTCPEQIAAFYVGFVWENGGGNNEAKQSANTRMPVDYVFPKYGQTIEYEKNVVDVVDAVLNEII